MKILTIVFFVFLAVVFIFSIINYFHSRKFISYFKAGNTVVSGLRGRGKDLAFCYVINKRRCNYISNIQYSSPKKKYKRFDFDIKVWELAGNTYKDFADGSIKSYVYPYPDGIDYYISDAGVYFPSQYHKELEKCYSSAPLFHALSRHLGDCNIHCNSQKQSRLWDKIREQSDVYIVMAGAFFIPKTKIFFVKYRVYDNEETAEKQLRLPFFGIGKRARESRNAFFATHGRIKSSWFVGRLPYAYDSRRFKKILENGCIDYET